MGKKINKRQLFVIRLVREYRFFAPLVRRRQPSILTDREVKALTSSYLHNKRKEGIIRKNKKSFIFSLEFYISILSSPYVVIHMRGNQAIWERDVKELFQGSNKGPRSEDYTEILWNRCIKSNKSRPSSHSIHTKKISHTKIDNIQYIKISW